MTTPAPTLVSACLLGCNCRYNAVVRQHDSLARAAGDPGIISVCPEVLGGLPTPRPAADIVGGDGADVLDGRARVVDEKGVDVTEEFLAGARAVLEVARRHGARRAVLKSRSPSCGVGELSTMEGGRRAGNGVTAELLRREGMSVAVEDFTDADSGGS